MKLITLLKDCGIVPADLSKVTNDDKSIRFYVIEPNDEQLDLVDGLTSFTAKSSNGITYRIRASHKGDEYTNKFGRITQRATNAINITPIATVTADDL